MCSLIIDAMHKFCVELITSHQGSHKFAFTAYSDTQIMNDSFGSFQTCSIILLSNPSSLFPGTRSKALKEKHELQWKRGQNGNQGQGALKFQQNELDRLFCLSSFSCSPGFVPALLNVAPETNLLKVVRPISLHQIVSTTLKRPG